MIDRLGKIGPPFGQERRRLLEVREEHRDVRVAPERRIAAQTFEQQAAERVDVGSTVDLLARDLLRGNVVDGPDELPVLREPHSLRQALGQTEVGEVGMIRALVAGAGSDQDVRRLDVSMDEPTGMGEIERARDLGQQVDRLRGRQGALPEPGPQVGPFDVAHRDEQVPVGLARLVDRNDVRMVDRRCEFGLGQEAFAEGSAGGEGRGQDLQRDLTLEAEILCEVDLAHPAASEQPLHR